MRYIVFLILLTLSGCASIQHKILLSKSPQKDPRKIAIFFDGTANNEVSDTNVKRLHSLITLQDRAEIATLYIEGVGVEKDALGAALGIGMKDRVRIAYEFIWNNYRSGDDIYIFGFSRGAYSARVLAAVLHYAGLPRPIFTDTRSRTSTEIAEDVYDAYKQYLEEDEEDKRKEKLISELKTKWRKSTPPKFNSVHVEFLGLWDTVEALGKPDYSSRVGHRIDGFDAHPVTVDVLNRYYGDQLCNVKYASQALSIDDNREWIFTPLLITRKHLFKNCTPQEFEDTVILNSNNEIRPGHLSEVWFSGAHSDVGGGYNDSRLSGVSLNWMIEELQCKTPGLLPEIAKVPEDIFGTSHDPQGGVFKHVYHKMTRNIISYVTDENNARAEFLNSMCVHPSVFKRRLTVPLKSHENDLLELRGPEEAIDVTQDCRTGKSFPQRWWSGPEAESECESVLIVKNSIPSPTVQEWPNCKGIQQCKVVQKCKEVQQCKN